MAIEIAGITRMFLSKDCYQILMVDFNYLHVDCLVLLVSKILGYTIIIVTSLFMQMPQVIKILRSRSGEGVSVISQAMLLMAATSAISYGIAKDFPISTWGENIALSVQNLAICNLILVYDNRPKASVLFTCIYVTIVLILLSPIVSLTVLTLLEMTSLPLATGGKLVQIVHNYQRGSTGQLSAATVFFMNFRSFGRLFTSAAETGDLIKTLTFGSVSILNVTLVLQMFYYRLKNKIVKRNKKTVKQKQG